MRSEAIRLEGHTVTIGVQVSKRARNISLRVDERSGEVELVLPRFVSRSEGMSFVQQKKKWILQQLGELPPRVPFEHGAIIPVMGCEYRIEHIEGARGTVWLDDRSRTIQVAGQAPHVSRRVTDWLKHSARAEISGRAQEAAARLRRPIRRIQIRDTRSRWGSCSEDGRLSFSWRLMLAPENVLDYVVAHETAHLVELNHSKRFWSLVDDLCPNNGPAKHWLKRHGATLHRYG